jgi:hypothetical protein
MLGRDALFPKGASSQRHSGPFMVNRELRCLCPGRGAAPLGGAPQIRDQESHWLGRG